MLPNPSDLTYFTEIANTGNISRASERLGISQPSLSVSIKRLEENVGVQLLVRTKTGVRLTRAGRQLLKQVEILLGDWEKLRDSAQESESEVSGRYSLGCHSSVALYSLHHFIPKLMDAHPRLDFTFPHDHSRKLTEDVISFKLDLALVINPVQHPDLVIKPILNDLVSLYTAKKPTPMQTPGHEKATLIVDPELSQSQDIMKKLNKKSIQFRRTIHTTNLEVIGSLVESGAGVGILPGRVAATCAPTAVLLPGKNPTFKDHLAVVYRADLPKTAALRAIIDSIVETLKD